MSLEIQMTPANKSGGTIHSHHDPARIAPRTIPASAASAARYHATSASFA
jgi:hypothetical protein